MNRSKLAILSSPLLMEEGDFSCYKISLAQAEDIVNIYKQDLENFSGHETVKILGLEPDKSRKECQGYEKALVIKPLKRLEFGKEYSVEEILEIGVEILLIECLGVEV